MVTTEPDQTKRRRHGWVIAVEGNAEEGAGMLAQTCEALSEAETKALQALADHGCVMRAAKALGVAYKTVELQLAACRRKLDCVSTAQAVAKGLRQGLIR
ncbi:MAG: hypothetical protein IT204_10375 [Fimbriimonadaceae bacterium]|nr:hypothetical protein [Fimbriimonadaceae bacterium]